MKTIEYKLKGTRRQAGAIGKPAKFTVTVSRQIGTMTPRDAMDTARRAGAPIYQNQVEASILELVHGEHRSRATLGTGPRPPKRLERVLAGTDQGGRPSFAPGDRSRRERRQDRALGGADVGGVHGIGQRGGHDHGHEKTHADADQKNRSKKPGVAPQRGARHELPGQDHAE